MAKKREKKTAAATDRSEEYTVDNRAVIERIRLLVGREVNRMEQLLTKARFF